MAGSSVALVAVPESFAVVGSSGQSLAAAAGVYGGFATDDPWQ
jgi:hypothetical protein